MLILSNPPPASWPVCNLEKQEHDKGEAVPVKTTLIVMPANLLQQWQDELAKHVQNGALKWYPPLCAAWCTCFCLLL